MHDNTLTTDNRDKFIYVAGRYNQLVKFYNVDELCADKLAEITGMIPSVQTSVVSVASMYRFLIPQLLEIDKCIYLDSDIVVNMDIAELWRIELGEKIFGVVPEAYNGVRTEMALLLVGDGYVKKEDYFNAGVLLMNLKLLRDKAEFINVGIKFYNEHPQYGNFDQDILNYLFAAESLKLPAKFNYFVRDARSRGETKIEHNIYHYLSTSWSRGVLLDMRDSFNRLWMNYFMQTPWFDTDTIGRLYAGVQQLHVSFKSVMVNISAIMSGKTRTFFDVSRNIEALKKIFSVRDDEEIITAENDGLKKLLDAMNTSRGKKVFFIMIPNFPYQILIDAGFVFGKDFVNGMEFLSEAQGVPLNSYPLIQAM